MTKSSKIGPNRRGNAGKGRPKGSQNKITRTIRQAIEASFDILGGEEWLVELGRSDPKAYATLLARLVPTEIRNEPTMVFKLVNALPDLDDEELPARGEPLPPALP